MSRGACAKAAHDLGLEVPNDQLCHAAIIDSSGVVAGQACLEGELGRRVGLRPGTCERVRSGRNADGTRGGTSSPPRRPSTTCWVQADLH
jgi:hypothetical protein